MELEQLKKQVANQKIDTVVACIVDMQGRLMGKRFHAQFFLDSAIKHSHICNYLLATDIEMSTIDGFKSTSWESGYGDYIMKPDISTLRSTPWLEGTALVLCDVLDCNTHKEITHSPRSILKKQIKRLEKMGIGVKMATELEFFTFNQSFFELSKTKYKDIELVSSYNQDYHIFQTTKEERLMRAIRNGLFGAGISVECSKGEASAGQEEINILCSDALNTADQHSFVKNACKEIAWLQGKSITFMAKWSNDSAGNSSHIHQSLWSLDGENCLFFAKNERLGMSKIMQQYIAGLLTYATDYTYFLAPNVNSYKRFKEQTFAPTKIVWSEDNRTAGFRLCGANSKSIRVECRIGGSDLNPYLALAAQLAAGIEGIEKQFKLPKEFKGDAYRSNNTKTIPNNLTKAYQSLDQSTMLRNAFGDDVINHYLCLAKWEQNRFEKIVTDWELQYGFERS